MKPTRDTEIAPIVQNPEPAKWEDVDKWMERFPQGVVFTDEYRLRSYRIQCEAGEADEFGRRTIKSITIRMEVKTTEKCPPRDASAVPSCENPVLADHVGAWNPKAYYCATCKKIHV